MTQIEPKMEYFGTQLENHTYKFLTFLHKGRGISVEKTGEACHSWKIQNWGFQTIFCSPILGSRNRDGRSLDNSAALTAPTNLLIFGMKVRDHE